MTGDIIRCTKRFTGLTGVQLDGPERVIELDSVAVIIGEEELITIMLPAGYVLCVNSWCIVNYWWRA